MTEHMNGENSGASYMVSHIEWEVPNGIHSAEFLDALFGWGFQQFSEHYWLYEPQDGVAVGLLEKPDAKALSDHCPIFIDVPSIDHCLLEAERLGASVVELKMDIPDYGAWAKIKEPGGNTIGLFERHQP
ncbi:MAG: hypothetical protein OXT49_09200 [Gammaproteobacteria bacterium]|nr:hypothetical protein [Gammaproteobacteria bacterium]